ncbi:MAG: hypothetical protein PHQ43_10085 [Dehalococcoidales bacterium]|nr:hypothetical protein [Dehalococcoidales bacterium]
MEGDIVFKCEDSLWQLMASGKKQWDARQYDVTDERIFRLSMGAWEKDPPQGRQPAWLPREQLVAFLNNLTGETLIFRFRWLRFVSWAPGWVFICLGGRVQRLEADGAPVDESRKAK